MWTIQVLPAWLVINQKKATCICCGKIWALHRQDLYPSHCIQVLYVTRNLYSTQCVVVTSDTILTQGPCTMIEVAHWGGGVTSQKAHCSMQHHLVCCTAQICSNIWQVTTTHTVAHTHLFTQKTFLAQHHSHIGNVKKTCMPLITSLEKSPNTATAYTSTQWLQCGLHVHTGTAQIQHLKLQCRDCQLPSSSFYFPATYTSTQCMTQWHLEAYTMYCLQSNFSTLAQYSAVHFCPREHMGL